MMPGTDLLHKTGRLLGALALVFAITGCTSLTFRVNGTKGAAYSGWYICAVEPDKKTTISGKLPYWETTIGDYPLWHEWRVTQCEIRKDDTNAVLRLDLREHRYHVVAVSPAGTAGVRLTWNRKGYDSEMLTNESATDSGSVKASDREK